MNHSDQDIDTAGTEADEGFRQRHEGEPLESHDATAEPLGIPPDESDTARGSDPRTLHRAEDDPVAFERSPEFHDQPGSGREAGTQGRPEGTDRIERTGRPDPSQSGPEAVRRGRSPGPDDNTM